MESVSSNKFSPSKYLGKWYQIAHYPSWFSPSATWNTTARYSDKGKYIAVKNSTYRDNQKVTVEGKAVYLGGRSFHVSFPGFPDPNPDSPNYIINQLWRDRKGNYRYSIVTNEIGDQLFVLSREAEPPLNEVSQVMSYVFANFDRRKIAMTSHYH